MRRRVIWIPLLLVLILAAAGGAGAYWFRGQLRASLPELDGTHQLAGLDATVTVARDALGIPTIQGTSRRDVARATGFVHAQDRFFQMDLTRRRAAGELAALVGVRALEADRAIRRHRFRAQARRAVDLLPARDRDLLESYAAGVNAGLSSLGARPFEYVVLRQEPVRWLPEDSFLVVLSMFITLQDGDGAYESMLGTIHDVLPQPVADFVSSPGTNWDTPVIGSAFVMPPVPGPEVYNLRARRTGKPPVIARSSVIPDPRSPIPDEGSLGSNNWVVAGRLSSTGAPLVANDMHLTVRVPNTWYRARLDWTERTSTLAPSHPRTLIGVTLPGVPALVVGSNTHVAWGFTNTYADWADIVLLELDPSNPDRYRTPGGWREFEHYRETIDVAGAAAAEEAVRWTIWGPVIGVDHRDRLRALRWVAHSADQLAAKGLTPFESATTLAEALEDANGRGTPGQNMVVADRDGHIGWTIYGSLPKRMGLDGSRPTSWADGSRGWSGWLTPAEYPRLVDPPGGRLWTANARVVDGAMLAALGDGSYEVGSRARIIRNRLHAAERFTPRDMLAIQLDDSALFLDRWRQLLLNTLTPPAPGAEAPGAKAAASPSERRTVRDLVATTWTGRASPSSPAYALTRIFREEVSMRVMTFLFAECYEADAAFDHTMHRRREGPVWALVTERPMHLLDPAYPTWDALLLAAIDATIEQAMERGSLDQMQWGRYNVTTYRHPLSASLPFVGRLLDMPIQPVPGDLFTPRVAWGSNAASQRMVVSPGREAEGIMQMPTGQSGHPLSPFYGNSHPTWIAGAPSPFLPGPPAHRLTLTP
jgi:penicillin amidase